MGTAKVGAAVVTLFLGGFFEGEFEFLHLRAQEGRVRGCQACATRGSEYGFSAEYDVRDNVVGVEREAGCFLLLTERGVGVGEHLEAEFVRIVAGIREEGFVGKRAIETRFEF